MDYTPETPWEVRIDNVNICSRCTLLFVYDKSLQIKGLYALAVQSNASNIGIDYRRMAGVPPGCAIDISFLIIPLDIA